MQSMVERLPGVAPPIRRSNPNSYADTPFVEEIASVEMPIKFSFLASRCMTVLATPAITSRSTSKGCWRLQMVSTRSSSIEKWQSPNAASLPRSLPSKEVYLQMGAIQRVDHVPLQDHGRCVAPSLGAGEVEGRCC
uniref:Uncharacterized protein n=1 Tax=Brassica campestris TaxID=3711 RepID=A0A3P5Z4I9_BRACM|nr:unnamed protein product [Brassica rapa]